ncbi:MAG: SLC13 family permease [Rhodospirillales bacterium]|nr:MAG: SLC13 family permease [Rhodospirillales bacterium]
MTPQQIFLLGLLGCVLALFAWGRWRYDIIAFAALMAATLGGTVPFEEVFSGFGHPATVTVALVLVVSAGLRNAGAVDLVARYVLPPVKAPTRQIGLLASVGGALSTFMNNVGALALLMPAALQVAARAGHSPAIILMPLSFGCILGGLVTLIGTPPNIIIATFRGQATGTPFTMFDFSPVGGILALAGIAFVALIGWRLIPRARAARQSPRDLFAIDNYVSEAEVPEDSPSVGRSLKEMDELAAEKDATVLRLIRGDRRIDGPSRLQQIEAGDILIVEVSPTSLEGLLSALALRPPEKRHETRKLLGITETEMMEAVVLPRSVIEGRTAEGLRLRDRFGVNLVAVSRKGRPYRGRLRSFRFQAGDVLLAEGDPERLTSVITTLGCLALGRRGMVITSVRWAVLSMAIFGAAIAAATLGFLSMPVALGLAAVAMVLLNIVPLRELYSSVDWPVIVLLAAMIPVGGALQTTGTTDLLATGLLELAAGVPPAVILAVIIVITMTLSDIINNAATAVLMAPLAMAIAGKLGVSADPFLMGVAVGASCAFLTPIGHQNNTIILGPGGYAFGDYWRMGLPLEILIVTIAVPAILWVWPL